MVIDDGMLRAGVFAVLFAALLILEAWRPWRFAARAMQPRRLDNLVLLVLGTVLLRFAFPMLALDVAFVAEQRGWGLLRTLDVGGMVAAVAGFLLLDLSVYAQHIAMHRVPWLWRLHAVHHADTQLDVTTGLRFHPVELAASMLWKMSVVALVGASPATVLAFEIALNAGSMFSHSNIRLGAGLERVLRVVLVTPAMHRIHHSVNRDECDSNYGFSFSFWDRLLRTYRARAVRLDDVEFGAPGREAPSTGIMGLLLAPFRAIK